jgi:hypothetical protein
MRIKPPTNTERLLDEIEKQNVLMSRLVKQNAASEEWAKVRNQRLIVAMFLLPIPWGILGFVMLLAMSAFDLFV